MRSIYVGIDYVHVELRIDIILLKNLLIKKLKLFAENYKILNTNCRLSNKYTPDLTT